MKNKVMKVHFLENVQDLDQVDGVTIEYDGKKSVTSKNRILGSIEEDIIAKGFVVENNITKQNIGDFVYYQFYYFDGQDSKNIELKIPRTDLRSNIRMERILLVLKNPIETITDQEPMKEKNKTFTEIEIPIIIRNKKPEIIFDEKRK